MNLLKSDLNFNEQRRSLRAQQKCPIQNSKRHSPRTNVKTDISKNPISPTSARSVQTVMLRLPEMRGPGRPRKIPVHPECPICSCQIIGDEGEINEHIDQCMQSGDATETDIADNYKPHPYSILPPGQSSHLVDVLFDEEASKGTFDAEDDSYTLECLQAIVEDRESLPSSLQPPPMLTRAFLAECSSIDSLRSAAISQQAWIADHLSRCTICLEPFDRPVVSRICWHVHCEACWAQTILTKRLCPRCNVIVSPSDLKRIYL